MSFRCRREFSTAVAMLTLLARIGWVEAGEPAQQDAPSRNRAVLTGTELNNRGVQEARAGRFEQGVVMLRQALSLAPNDPKIRSNLSGMLTDWATQLEQGGKADQAMTALKEALEHDPDNGKALVRLGELSYASQDLSRAIDLWKRSYGNIPTAHWHAISRRISQAERDRAIERTFTDLTSTHFQVRFETPEQAHVASSLRDTLEREYQRLASALGTGPARFTVIVYTGESFQRMAGQRDWAFGLYDGRIRLRLDEVGAAWLPQILVHELAHGFLAQAYGPRIPTWIHEGFAQAQEPPQPFTERQQALYDSIRAGTAWVPLKWLDRHFQQPSSLDDVERAYMEARAVIEFLVTRYGMGRLTGFLKRLAGGDPLDEAFDQTFAPLRWARIDQGIPE
ncbi:MAG: tetratricopeptide repeat protein [Candidatus Omnitrophica bacterium]|nr:tetratricopeptide repeat protein [Candidatus Omnitrophota bacterium]